MKNDQDGSSCLPKHVYANPKEPSICAVLSGHVRTSATVLPQWVCPLMTWERTPFVRGFRLRSPTLLVDLKQFQCGYGLGGAWAAFRNDTFLLVLEVTNMLDEQQRSFYPSTFRCVLPFLLASIVHHQEWLRSTLHTSHPLFLSLLWTSGVVQQLTPRWTWNGKIHAVPQGFEFPTCKVIDLWNLWWLGIPTEKIGPLRRLKTWDISRAGAGNLSKARHVINTIVSFSNLSGSDMERLALSKLHEQFRPCFLRASQWTYGEMTSEELRHQTKSLLEMAKASQKQ
ncbi:hypothetical protein H257_09049 [Aphanomyces astaci]|uniref:Uncharacterized protein n=1 Tax=Aphanomyces astaci TaxID=112090 RepID=W4GBX6_APHAT|nr:hypothetical protein H257_09049 [Aphanomyces astaci]ETV77165.1 hypothetical protein H257_09049 [Aphanomyces astaci]|eukprot:XP_009833471.1 hypothetical protein H257_09049 [Aphanomyces astaci]